MRGTRSEIYLHFVWATYQRMPLITPEREPALYTRIQQEVRRLDCHLLAIGGIADHIHLAIRMPPKIAPAHVMKQIKGVSSTFVRAELAPGEFFGRQEHYGVFSLSRPHRDRVIAYIHNQKEHHASGRLWWQWEETDEQND